MKRARPANPTTATGRAKSLLLAAAVLPVATVAGAATLSEKPMTATIHVTGQTRQFNGATEVPRGLFGVHATKLTPELVADWGVESVRTITQTPSGKPNPSPLVPMTVECYYDRYQPALVVSDPRWRETLTDLARRYGSAGGVHHLEFWNEPFLNWATRPGVNYDARFYEAAGRAEGAPMTIKGWDKPLDYLVWSRQLRLVDPQTGQVHYLANGDPPLQRAGLKEGDFYNFRGRQFRMDLVWWGRDITQHNYYSAHQNSQFYRWMLAVFGKALKETNPNVQLIGGWGFNIRSDGWRAWDVLFKPLLADCHPWLDALGEHHYGGDTRIVAADYEIAYAHALAAYGKRLKFYNTEAGGQLDPQRPDTPPQTKWGGNSPDDIRAGFTYLLRDVLHLIDKCPDKAVARAQHEAHSNPGVGAAFRFLKDLRGQLLVADSSTPGLWTVAARHHRQLCLVAFNDNLIPLTVNLRLDLPVRSGRYVQFGDDLKVREMPATNDTWQLPAKTAAKWLFELPTDGPLPARVETQYHAERILERASGTLHVHLPEPARQRARAAWLRIVHDQFETTATFNGTPVNLQREPPGIVDVALAISSLRATNSVEIGPVGKPVTAAVSLILAE